MARKSELVGREKVDRVFRAMPDDLRKRLSRTLRTQAARAKSNAVSLAPESSPLAGERHLRDDIHAEIIQDGAGAPRAQIGDSLPGNLGANVTLRVFAGTVKETAIAAMIAEFGRRPGGKRAPGHPGIPATRWWTVLRNSTAPRARRAVRAALRRLGKEATRRVG